jgi:polar amino acid transport system substrate-binding protein
MGATSSPAPSARRFEQGVQVMAKRLVSGFLLLLCGLVSPGAAAQTLIRAVTETTPWTYVRDGKPAGSATEIVEMTLRRAGLEHKVSIYPWARSYDMALHEPNVLIFMIARTAEREQQFKWAGEFMEIQYHLFKLRDRKDVLVTALADAERYAIGVIRDDVRHQYLQKKGHVRLVVSAESMDNFRKFLNGQVDLVALTENDARSLCAQSRIDCTRLEKVHTLNELSAKLYMAYSATTLDSIVDRTRAAFDKVKAEGGLKLLQKDQSVTR